MSIQLVGQNTVLPSTTETTKVNPATVETVVEKTVLEKDAVNLTQTAQSEIPAVMETPTLMVNTVIAENPKALRELTMKAAQYSEGALGRVIAEVATFYPEKLEAVLQHASEADYYRTQKVVEGIYESAKASGIELQKFPTEGLSKAMYARSASHIFKAGLIGVPLDIAFKSFDYHAKEIKANEYAAKSLDGFFSWAAFEAGIIGTTMVGSKMLGRNMGTFGKMSIGVGVGIVASSLYHRTAGHYVEKGLTHIIPESAAKPIADKIDKYFAAPIDKYVIQPIKTHPKTSIAVGVGIATALTLKYPVGFGKNFLLGFAGATAIGTVGTLGLDLVLPKPDHKAKPTVNPSNSGVINPNALGSTLLTQPKQVDSLPPLDQPISQEEIEWAVQLEAKQKTNPAAITPDDLLKYQNLTERAKAQKAK